MNNLELKILFLNRGEIKRSADYQDVLESLKIKNPSKIVLEDLNGDQEFGKEELNGTGLIICNDLLFFEENIFLIERIQKTETKAWFGIITASSVCFNRAKKFGVKNIKVFYRDVKNPSREKKSRESAFKELVTKYLKSSDHKKQKRAGFKKIK